MPRRLALTVLAVFGATCFVVPAATAASEFKLEVHDYVACPAGFDLCGKGNINGFGTVTTTLVFTGFEPGPDGCALATGVRTVTLTGDGSTLTLSLVGTICGQKLGGTFTITGGTGIFSGASGSGTLAGATTGIPVPSDTVQFRGTLELP